MVAKGCTQYKQGLDSGGLTHLYFILPMKFPYLNYGVDNLRCMTTLEYKKKEKMRQLFEAQTTEIIK